MKNNLYDFCCSAKKVLHLVAVLEWCSYQKYSEVSESNRKENCNKNNGDNHNH